MDTGLPTQRVEGANAELTGIYGFLPNLFQAQGDLPQVMAAEGLLLRAIVGRDSELRKSQKEQILALVADLRGNEYCNALYRNALPSATERTRPLLAFSSKLACYACWISAEDTQGLIQTGFEEAAVLETIAATA